MIYIFSSKNAAALEHALGSGKKKDWIEVTKQKPAKNKFTAGDQVYLDISGFPQAELKKALALFKKSGVFWGIIDPKGTAADAASFFFEGAGDYIGPAIIKKGLNQKRFAAAFSWASKRKGLASDVQKAANDNAADDTKAERKKTVTKLPGGKFEGWKSIRPGTNDHFFFLFASIPESSDLDSIIGESAFKTIRARLWDVLQQNLTEAKALLWMEKEISCLFLIPPRKENCKRAIEAVLKMILNTRLIGIETLGLSLPVDICFALHYGKTIYQAPGKTGSLISETINYIFHLGTKKAETGRLTITGDVPEEAIPEAFSDLFKPAGIFEKITLSHSKRFIHE